MSTRTVAILQILDDLSRKHSFEDNDIRSAVMQAPGYALDEFVRRRRTKVNE